MGGKLFKDQCDSSILEQKVKKEPKEPHFEFQKAIKDITLFLHQNFLINRFWLEGA